MAAVSDVPYVTWEKIAVGARHRLFLRVAFSAQKSAF